MPFLGLISLATYVHLSCVSQPSEGSRGVESSSYPLRLSVERSSLDGSQAASDLKAGHLCIAGLHNGFAGVHS